VGHSNRETTTPMSERVFSLIWNMLNILNMEADVTVRQELATAVSTAFQWVHHEQQISAIPHFNSPLFDAQNENRARQQHNARGASNENEHPNTRSTAIQYQNSQQRSPRGNRGAPHSPVPMQRMRYTNSHKREQPAVHSGKATHRFTTRQRKQRSKAAQQVKTNWSDLGILSETWTSIDQGGDKSVVSSLTAEQHYLDGRRWLEEGSIQPQDSASNCMEGVHNSLDTSLETGFCDSNSTGSTISNFNKGIRTKKPQNPKQQMEIASIIQSKCSIKRQHHWMEQEMGRKAILREETIAYEYLQSVHTHLQQLLEN